MIFFLIQRLKIQLFLILEIFLKNYSCETVKKFVCQYIVDRILFLLNILRFMEGISAHFTNSQSAYIFSYL